MMDEKARNLGKPGLDDRCSGLAPVFPVRVPHAASPPLLSYRGGAFKLTEKTLLMGILNLTPDSFSDGGLYSDRQAALRQAEILVAAGADLIDVGGESTRPGSGDVTAAEEIQRVTGIISLLAARGIPVSVDSWKAETAEAALQAGAGLINDVYALQGDPAMASVAARYGAAVILMNHPAYYRPERAESKVFGPKKGLTPPSDKLLRQTSATENVLEQAKIFLSHSLELALRAGIPEQSIMLDPGIGFGLSLEENLFLCDRLPELKALGFPILLAPSRKRFIRAILGQTAEAAEAGTGAVAVWGVARGAEMLRLHDLTRHAPAIRMADALLRHRAQNGREF